MITLYRKIKLPQFLINFSKLKGKTALVTIICSFIIFILGVICTIANLYKPHVEQIHGEITMFQDNDLSKPCIAYVCSSTELDDDGKTTSSNYHRRVVKMGTNKHDVMDGKDKVLYIDADIVPVISISLGIFILFLIFYLIKNNSD